MYCLSDYLGITCVTEWGGEPYLAQGEIKHMRKYLVSASILALVIAVFALPLATFAGPPDSATMQFGRPDLGSGCNFPCVDDASFHAIDKIAPGAVAISAGGTVYFEVNGVHQVAIYEPGITPKDIEPDDDAFPFVNDAEGRIFLGGFNPAMPFTDSFTFEEPGKYLVICNITPHFEEAQMWGWVIVK
jgi:plastocyanin